ncbi:hypothetical protein ACIBEA_44250, partial [Streptomyces sp. NPDC051555]
MVSVIVLLITAAWSAARSSAYASPAGIHEGPGSIVTIDFPADAQAFAVAVQPDGRVVTAGTVHQRFALARQRTDGHLDAGFGDNGTAEMGFGAESMASALVLQPDGRILAGGYTDDGTGNTHFALARFHTDGTPDETFGNAGKTTTHFADTPDQTNDQINSLALQPDGKILAGGYTDDGTGNTHFALARFHTDGTPDETFG